MLKRHLRNTMPRLYSLGVQAFTKWSRIGPTRKFIRELLNSPQPIHLEIGSGPRKGIKGGWVTADICGGADIWMDLLENFPFPDSSVAKIYSSHVFEHFYTHQLEFILSECKRVLNPGGTLSVCVPNTQIYVDMYHDPDTFDPEKHCTYKPGFLYYSKIDYLNYVAYLGGHHRHMFDQENLVEMLSKNGFRNSRSRGFDYEIDLPERMHESIYVEAEK